MFNSNVQPKVRREERKAKDWQCPHCTTVNPPWWKQCKFCSVRRPK